MHPELVRIGGFTLPSFTAAIVLGLALSLGVGFLLARKLGLDLVEFTAYAIFLGISFWLGSVLYRLFFMFLQSPQEFLHGLSPLGTLIQRSGTSVIGGIAGALLFSTFYLRKVGLPFWGTLDVAFTSIPLAQAAGRVGCFLAGCCYGRATGWWLGVTFPGHTQAVHPVQLYESALNLVNFAVLITLFLRRRFEGQILALYLVNYSVIRFILEYWRGDTHRGFLFVGGSRFTSLSLPQAMCLIGIAVGILIWRRRSRTVRATRT